MIAQGELNIIVISFNIIERDMMPLDKVPENNKVQCVVEGI